MSEKISYIEKYIAWQIAAEEWCIEACGLKPNLSQTQWLELYNRGLSSMEAGTFLAGLI